MACGTEGKASNISLSKRGDGSEDDGGVEAMDMRVVWRELLKSERT